MLKQCDNITNTHCLKIINLAVHFTHARKRLLEPCCSPLREANRDAESPDETERDTESS